MRAGTAGNAQPAHGLVRDAVVQTLDESRRRRLHSLVARALDRSGAEPGLVAAHIEAAADPDLLRRGVTLAVVACRRALGLRETDLAIVALARVDRLAEMLDSLRRRD